MVIAKKVYEALGNILKGKPIIYDLQKNDEDGYDYSIDYELVSAMLKRFIPEISKNEIGRYLTFTFEDMLESLPFYLFEEGNIDKINRRLYREIESDSKFWMQLHSDKNMRI